MFLLKVNNMSNCSECAYIKTNDPGLYGKFWCEKKLERVSAVQIEYYRFCRAYSRSYSKISALEQFSKTFIILILLLV